MFFPIGPMVMVYLPTNLPQKSTKSRYINIPYMDPMGFISQPNKQRTPRSKKS